MRAIAIDDEPSALKIIEMFASKVQSLDLKATFTDVFTALDYLQKEPIDLLFLDIKMPDITGLEFYNNLTRKPMVIFTTAYSQHAVSGFELNAIDYLLKPFSLARFIKGYDKALEIYNLRKPTPDSGHLFIKLGFEQVRIDFEDILYIEGAGNYVNFVLREKNILSRSSINEVKRVLPADKFVRIHRSYIIAINKIDKLEKHRVTINKFTLPIGDGFRQHITEIAQKRP